jgi:hypothetical protein
MVVYFPNAYWTSGVVHRPDLAHTILLAQQIEVVLKNLIRIFNSVLVNRKPELLFMAGSSHSYHPAIIDQLIELSFN